MAITVQQSRQTKDKQIGGRGRLRGESLSGKFSVRLSTEQKEGGGNPASVQGQSIS